MRAPQNGMFINDSSATVFIPGQAVMFTCNPGFIPQGIMEYFCQEDGMWNQDPHSVLCQLQAGKIRIKCLAFACSI